MIYLYVVKSGTGEIFNQYWDRKTTQGIECIVNMYSTRTPMEDGFDKSNRDAVILNIIPVDSGVVTINIPNEKLSKRNMYS